MTRQAIGRIVLPAFVLATAVVAGASARVAAAYPGATLRDGRVARSAIADETQKKGRYKKDGRNCVWDANDTGPNQCTPAAAGHFKKVGNSCTWETNDSGRDECRPAKGRFKRDGTRCVWNGTDSGPDQCDPRRAR